MKKITIAILATLFSYSIASAELGISIGVSGQVGTMEASGKEVSSDGTTETSPVRETLFGTAGFFIEKDLKFLPIPIVNRLSVGFSNISHDLDMGTADNIRAASLGTMAINDVKATDHSVNAKITGFETVYATLNITDWLYVKAGSLTVDVESNYRGSATSTYATQHALDGSMKGIGISKTTDNGLFMRLEYNDYDIDGKSVANTGAGSKFTATLNDVSGSTGRISIGKKF
tara:strand:- start:539 stop:1231 length:693 start_codon:yes stop_codon:yes gene_type:complete